jgi:chemotaxis protein CheX
VTSQDLIEPFVKATTRVLETMAFLKPEPGQPYTKRRGTPSGDVTGVVGITGSGHTGSVAVSFSEPCIKALVSNMLGEEVERIGLELLDAVGELTNMISGAARSEFASAGLDLDAGIPAVVWGRAHVVAHASEVPVTVIPFNTVHGPFSVEACFEESRRHGDEHR